MYWHTTLINVPVKEGFHSFTPSTSPELYRGGLILHLPMDIVMPDLDSTKDHHNRKSKWSKSRGMPKWVNTRNNICPRQMFVEIMNNYGKICFLKKYILTLLIYKNFVILLKLEVNKDIKCVFMRYIIARMRYSDLFYIPFFPDLLSFDLPEGSIYLLCGDIPFGWCPFSD